MSRTYEITTAASQDVDAMLSRLAEVGGYETADKFLNTFNTRLKNLVAFPFIGVARPD